MGLFWDHSAEKFRKLDVVANLLALLSLCSNVEILFSPSTNDLSLAQSIELEKSFNGKLSRVIRSHISFLYISRTCSTCAFKSKYFLKSFFRNFSSETIFRLKGV